jgi:signal transduction histidine kinase
MHAGVRVGTLTVGLAPGDEALGRGERAVVDALVPVLAAAVHASSLAVEVQRSRERLVTAREDERRRLRRDLHDGLGPVLAGITMEIQAARTLLDVDEVRAREMLEAAERWAREAVGEVRRVVYGLRPPVLDQLGLVRAVEEHIASLDQHGSRLSVEIRTSGELGGLPAGAEVAAYLIALEALTNVVRHARAAHCSISLSSTADTVELEVIDDGDGFEEQTPFGVGLSSMRERAEELGGVVVVGRGVERGTRVLARIPVSPA